MAVDSIFPLQLEIKYNYLRIDGQYITTISIIKYETNIELFETIQKMTFLDETEVVFHFKRQDNAEFLKKLTNIISKSNSEIRSVSDNQLDINILDGLKQNASMLRKKIQIDNEQIYELSAYIVLKDEKLEMLISRVRDVINNLYSNRIIARPCNFKQKEAYLATLPLLKNDMILKKYNNCILTENGVVKLFPFYNEDIFYANGVIIGRANNNLCSVDVFGDNNSNYNMCIFGTSGAGKSYFVKLLIIKYAYKGIRQIIIDPEGEYTELINKLGGTVYSRNNYNPFEINESFLEEENFFEKKIVQIVDYLKEEFNLDCDDEQKQAIIELYRKFGILKNKESFYEYGDDVRVYTKPRYKTKFPSLYDFFKLINYQEGLEYLKNVDITENKTNVTNLFCFNLKGKMSVELSKEMKIYIPKLMELVKKETIIYFDELWKCIYSDDDNYVISNIYNMFKTFRKKRASTVIISQDICDLFNIDNGNFGKSILNNTSIKVLFKMEWSDLEIFERLLNNRNTVDAIRKLERGKAYVSINSANFEIQIEATEFEHMLIEGE